MKDVVRNNKYGQLFNLLIGTVTCLIGLLSAFYFAQYGAFFSDEPYQILVTKNYIYSPLTFISGFLSNQWGILFGFGVLSMRYYSVTIQLVSLILCCSYLYLKTKRLFLVLLISGMCGFLMNTNMLTYAVGWDATSLGFITCTSLSLLCYQDKPSLLRLFALSSISAMAIFSRIPNIVIVPLTSLYLFGIIAERYDYKHGFQMVSAYICIVLLISVALIVSFYGSISNYVDMIKSNTVSNHTMGIMIRAYIEDGIKIILKLSFIYTLYRIFVITNRSKYYWMHVMGMVLIMIVAYGYIRYNSLRHFFDLSNLLYALMLFVICFVTKIQMVNKTGIAIKSLFNEIDLKLIMIFCFSLIPIIGSNTGFNKAVSVPLFPLLLSFALPDITNDILFK